MDDVLGNSGVSVGSFYYLFKNKVDLAATLYVETQQQLYEALLERLSECPDGSARVGIAALMQAYMQWASDHPKEMYYLIFCRDPEVKNDEREQTAKTEFNSTVITWLQPCIERGELRPLAPQQYLALLFGPGDYLIHSVLDSYDANHGAGNGSISQQLRDDLLHSADPLTEAICQALMRAEA
jgi:AcrR family transcriptional regulator